MASKARSKHRARGDEAPISSVKPVQAAATPAGSGRLLVAKAVSVDDAARRATLRFEDGTSAEAELARALAPEVVRTAIARDEALLVQDHAGGWLVLGALRTAPTPGLEKGDAYVIEARRIELRGDHEVALVSGRTTQIVLRAVGLIETLASDISTRASGVHKLIGRMLHLN